MVNAEQTSERGLSVVVAGPAYEGYVVIDTFVENKSAGGVRVAGDLPLAEVRELAREMSYKFALFHLPRGGAKAGVRMDDGLSPADRDRALEDFGAKLAPLIRNGLYSPGMDMNCGPDQLRAIYRGAGISLGEITDTSWFTAISVFHCLEATVQARGLSAPVSLAIEGFGSVARFLSERLDPERYQIQAVSTFQGGVRPAPGTTPAALAAAKVEHGDALVTRIDGEALPREDVLTAAVDVVLPSSRTWVITPDVADRVQAKAVVPISNAPFVDDAVARLHGRDIVCLPGYVSNVGGVLASSLYDQGLSKTEVEGLFDQYFRPAVDGILRLAAARQSPPTEIAASLAEGHMPDRARLRARSLPTRIVDRFVRPRLPRSIRANQVRNDFARRLRSLAAEISALERS